MRLFLSIVFLSLPVLAQDAKDPCPVPGDVRSERLVYANQSGTELALRMYVKGEGNEASQAVIVLPGLSRPWRDVECYAIELAQRGFVAAVAEYRSPRVALYPAAINDAIAAVTWMHGQAEEHGLRVNSVGLIGFGFGGYVASMAGLRSDDVQVVAAVDAVFDLMIHGYPIEGKYPYVYHAFLGVSRPEDPDMWRTASPVQHVTVNSPPHLLIGIENNGHASLSQIEAIAYPYREKNVWVRSATFPKADNILPGGEAYSLFLDQLARAFTDRFTIPDKSLSRTQNIVYTVNAGQELHLDVLRDPSVSGPRPAVLWFHGGGYVWGSKRDRMDLVEALAKEGYVVFSVEYTRASYRRAPAMLLDAHAAVAWVKENAAEFGVDPERIAAVGESAGGHLAAMLGIESQHGLDEPSPADVQAVVTISGVVDLPRLAERDWYTPGIVIGVPFEQGEEAWKRMSPAFRAHEGAAPFLALHGTDDALGTVEEMELFAEDLRSHGITAEVLVLDGGQHDFWRHEQYRLPALKKMIDFLEDVMN